MPWSLPAETRESFKQRAKDFILSHYSHGLMPYEAQHIENLNFELVPHGPNNFRVVVPPA